MRLRSLRAIVGVGLALFLAAFGPTVSASGSTPATATVVKPMCSKIVVFGVRGSRTNAQDTGMADSVVNRFFNQFRYAYTGQRVPPQSVIRMEMVRYPAVPVTNGVKAYGANYMRSVDAGVRELAAIVRTLKATCPKSAYVATGFSQGANVIGEFGRDYWREGLLNNGLAFVLFGNPARNQNVTEIELYKLPSGSHGILYSGLKAIGWPSPQDELTTPKGYSLLNTIDGCDPRDPVCSFKGDRQSYEDLANCALFSCSHFDYVVNGWTGLAAERVTRLAKSHMN